MKKIVVICISIFLISSLYAGNKLDTPAEILSKANEYFNNGIKEKGDKAIKDILLAASLFEKLVDEKGIINGYLFYNIGNCYFKVNQIGKAIFYYRVAEKFIPSYPDLSFNLHSAISKRKDKITERQIDTLLDAIFFWKNWLNPGTQIALFLIFFILIWISLGVKKFYDAPLFRWFAIIGIAVAFLMSISLGIVIYEDAYSTFGTIVVEEIDAKKGPGKTYESSFQNNLHEGTEFDVIEKQDEWVHVRLKNEKECWLPSNTVMINRYRLFK